MENKTADTQYYRKVIKILHTIRYVVLLVLIIFVIIGFTTFKRELTYDNFRYIMKYVNFNISYDYTDSNNISFVADDGALYGYLKGDLAILSPKGFTTYDFSGAELLYDKLTYPNPSIKTAGKYALCYDVTGTSLNLYNSYSNLQTKQFDYGIKDACVRSDGSYAVSTSGKHLRSKVVVYEDDGEFTYETKDKEVMAVSLPENSDKVNFVALTVENGDFKFMLMSYNTRDKAPVMQREFKGEFPLKLYSDNNMICLLTDKALHFIDYDGNSVAEYNHNTDNLSGFYQSGKYIALTYTRSVTEESTVKIFNTLGNEISSENFENHIIGFSSYNDRIYALEKGRLHIMDVNTKDNKINGETSSYTEVDSVFSDVFATSAEEYVLVSKFGAQQISY